MAEVGIFTTVVKILWCVGRPVAECVCPFKKLWRYEKNLNNLQAQVKELEAKKLIVQGITKAGIEPLPDVKSWLGKATTVINEVAVLLGGDDQVDQPETGCCCLRKLKKCCEQCSYSHLKTCCQHRYSVARKLKDVTQLLQEAMRSMRLWEYNSNIEYLKKEVKDLEARRESVRCLIKDGYEPLPHVKVWLKSVDSAINEVLRLINENNMENEITVAHRLNDVAQLLHEARAFREVSTISEERVYMNNLENLKNGVEKLVTKREDVNRSIKDGEEPLPNVKAWLDKVNSITKVVSSLASQYDPRIQTDIPGMLENVFGLMREAGDFREVSTISEETLYKLNLEKLKKEVNILKLKTESVQCLIKVGEVPLPDVKAWQDRVKEIIDEVLGLTIEHDGEKHNKVASMLNEVAQLLLEEAQFREFSYQPTPELTYLQRGIQLDASESRVKDIIATLGLTDVNMVGIYGMGGVGKTTLARKVETQATHDKLFDKMIFVEVSQSPDIKTIQGVIADCLGLKFQEETVPGRARKLGDVLKSEKKILIILDNLWKGIKFEEVGIPFGKDCKGINILLTARSCDVLTKEMDSLHNFHLEALNETDAWILFKSIAGTCVDHPHLKSIAHEVAKKCGGMPVAIVTVAKALKDTWSKDEWKDALRRLNNTTSESFEGIAEEVYNSIRLSYDYLQEKLKKIFLLCSRLGCTYDASIQDLFRYGLGLGFFQDFDTVDDALCNLCALVNQLKAVSLLLDAPNIDKFFHRTLGSERFAIHDVICDIARSIASKEQHVYTVLDDRIPRSLMNENKLKKCTSITLCNIGELPNNLELVCPNLEFLYVKPKDSWLRIPDNFFEGMSSLRVLHLIKLDLEPLPTTFSCLVNLHALCLVECQLDDVADIGDMKKLEILSFRGSSIQKLPEKMRQLTKLILLDLAHCSKLKDIPPRVISCLTGMEALYMNNTRIQWEVEGPDSEGSNANIDELKYLPRLSILEMHIPDAILFKGMISSKLIRYKISIGGNPPSWDSCDSARMLIIRLDTKADWIISQLPGVEEVHLYGQVIGARNLIDDMDRNGFSHLQHLRVGSNSHCVCLVNGVPSAVLPSLETLKLNNMRSMEKICKNPLDAESFHNLKTLHVEGCEKLSNISCFSSFIRVLPNLADLKISECKNIQEIFAIEEQIDGNYREVVPVVVLSQLSNLTLKNLPELKGFYCKEVAASPSIFTEKVSFFVTFFSSFWSLYSHNFDSLHLISR